MKYFIICIGALLLALNGVAKAGSFSELAQERLEVEQTAQRQKQEAQHQINQQQQEDIKKYNKENPGVAATESYWLSILLARKTADMEIETVHNRVRGMDAVMRSGYCDGYINQNFSGSNINCNSGSGIWRKGTSNQTFNGWRLTQEETLIQNYYFNMIDFQTNTVQYFTTDHNIYVTLKIKEQPAGQRPQYTAEVIDARLPDAEKITAQASPKGTKKTSTNTTKSTLLYIINNTYNKMFQQSGVNFFDFARQLVSDPWARDNFLEKATELNRNAAR